jgi:hypothetical protein
MEKIDIVKELQIYPEALDKYNFLSNISVANSSNKLLL